MTTSGTDTNLQGAERKLSVIMFTDIKGFSRKMAENEAGAFDLLKKHDALLRVLSTKFGGKVVKSIGDSFMVDFASAVNAVKCAIEAQKKFFQHNVAKSEFDKIEIRAGIHLGDVLIRGDDIFGDGVNVASRIESITAPTRICITADVYNQIRKSMDVEVFRMGNMTLKNIPEPVEVFEVLIPDIPEFAKPSEKAAAESKKQSLEASEKHAARVAGHESNVSLFHQQALTMSDEEKQTQAEEFYERAEKFFQMGRIEDAEAELKKVEELVPSFQPSEGKRQDEEEKESKVQGHLSRARSLISEGKLDDAEAETRKVFDHYPLHVGAQQILVRIEEERYKLEEEERLKKVAERRKTEQTSVEQQKVTDILDQARKLSEEESYTQAIYTLREVFSIDPNNSVARTLEQEIRQAQDQRARQDRAAAEDEERRLEEERLERQRKRKEREQAKKVARAARPAEKKKGSLGLLVLGALLIVFGVGLYISLPTIMRTFFPVRITVAAIPFTGSGDLGLTHGVPMLLVQDLSRVTNVSSRATTSSFSLDPRTFGSGSTANTLNVTHVLTGSYDSTDRGVELTVRLVDVKEKTAAFARRLLITLDRFPVQKTQLVEAIIDDIGIDGMAPAYTQAEVPGDAYRLFLTAQALLQTDVPEQLLQARTLMEGTIQSGVEFPEAAATLAEAYARLGRIGSATDDELDYAIGIVQNASKRSPNDPIIVRALATSLMAGQKHTQALAAIQRGIALSPQDAELHRLMAEISLIRGDFEAAAASIATAVVLDPTNPRTFLVKGWYSHLRGDAPEAARQYEVAIAVGGNRSFILSSFLASAWLRGTNRDGAVRYYRSLTEAYPSDYRLKYWLGRAYAERLDSAQIWFRDGLRLATEGLEFNREDRRARAYRALFLTRLGRFSDATSVLERLESDGVSDPVVLYRMANAYALQTKREKALELLSSALSSRYSLSEIVNPDFGVLFEDPDFRSLIVRQIQTAQ